MALKLTDLTALGTTPASGDFLHVVDIDDTTGSAEGTSKKVTYADLGIGGGGGGLLTQVETTVSNGQVLTMKYDDTPITLVSAEAGKIHVPVSVTMVTTWATPNESSSDDLRIGWDATVSTSADYLIGIRDFMNGLSSGTFTTNSAPFQNGFGTSYTNSAVNKPLQVWCTDVFNGGWSMVVYTTYYSITV